MTASRAFAALLAVALAPVLAVQAYVNSGGNVVQQAVGWNGFQLADRALSQVEGSEAAGQLQLRASAATVSSAKRAYEREPFATDALFVIGSMDRVTGTKIYRASIHLDKRNRTIAAMLLQDAARQKNLPAMLDLIDRLSRLRPAFAAEFVKAFAGNLADPESMPVLERALNASPVWANAFWKSVPRDGAALDNFYSLRSEISKGSDAKSDAALIRALVNAGRFDEAFEFRSSLAGGAGGLLTGSGEHYEPLHWQLSQGRNAQARFTSSNQLEVYIERGTAGELARKLVRLSPGTFTLIGRVVMNQGTGDIQAELICASGNQKQRWMAQLLSGETEWFIPAETCAYAWLIVKGSAWESPLPVRAVVDKLSVGQ